MRQIFLFLCILILTAACQKKKYDPREYEITCEADISSGENNIHATLRNECLTFMRYCDKNHTSNIKLFARDWIRTWKDWKTDGVKDYHDVLSCHISTKSRYNVKSVFITVYNDSVPPVFLAERNFYSTEYEDLVNMARSEFGPPDTEKEAQYGTIYKWFVDDSKTILTIPEHLSISFAIEYRLINYE